MEPTVAIACFVYRRPDLTSQMLNSLAANPESCRLPLYVFSDGAKTAEEKDGVEETRRVVESFSDSLDITFINNSENVGLSRQIISGVTKVLESYESVVVLEDDLILSPFFLRFMLDGLNVYQDCQKVISVHGYFYPHQDSLPDSFLLRGADCWGWATWRRGWELFVSDSDLLLNELTGRRLLGKFNYGVGRSYTKMLTADRDGVIDSWAVRWHASAILNNALTVYPGESLVLNAGHDGSGTHSLVTNRFESSMATRPLRIKRQKLVESGRGLRVVRNHLNGNTGGRTPRGGKFLGPAVRAILRLVRLGFRTSGGVT